MKDLAEKGKKGKELFHEAVTMVGSFEDATSVVDIPNHSQVYKLHQKEKGDDDLLEVLDLCNRQKLERCPFIRDVRTAPEVSFLLTYDHQLEDIAAFCSADHPWSVLSVDPTFNICDYNITITTYRNPKLVVENSEVHPVMIGPVLIHSHKTYESYYTLPSNMLRLCPELKDLLVFGTAQCVQVNGCLFQ